MSEAIATRMPRVCSVRRSWRLPVALVTAVVVAEAAVLVMRPRERGPEPVPVEPRAYFSAGADREGATTSATGQLLVYVAQTAVGLGVLGADRPAARRAGCADLAAPGARRRRRRRGDRRRRPPWPRCRSRAVARERAKDVGLVTQAWAGWPATVAKAAAIGAGLRRRSAAPLLVFGDAPVRPPLVAARAPSVVVAFGAITTYAGPVVLDPLFNNFTPLPQRRAAHATCSSSRARRASTSARSTRSTPPAARPPPTPT